MKNKTTESEYKQLSLFDLEDFSVEAGHERWAEGSVVKNICNDKEYTLKKDEGDIVEVFDKDKGYLIMAKADVKLVRQPAREGIFFWGKD